MITIGHVTPENIYIYILLFVVDGRKLMSFYHTLQKKKKVFSSIHPFTIEAHIRLIKSQRRLPPWPTSKARDNSVCLV